MSKLVLIAALGLGLGGSAKAGGTILFWTDSPIPSLRVMNPDGTHVRRIAAKQNAKRLGRSQIFVMNFDRTHLRNLSGKRVNEFDPSWR
jgi:hypothetical protein